MHPCATTPSCAQQPGDIPGEFVGHGADSLRFGGAQQFCLSLNQRRFFDFGFRIRFVETRLWEKTSTFAPESCTGARCARKAGVQEWADRQKEPGNGMLPEEGHFRWWVKIESRENATRASLIVEKRGRAKVEDPPAGAHDEEMPGCSTVSSNVPHLIGQQLQTQQRNLPH